VNLMGVDLGVHKVAVFGWDGDIPFVYARDFAHIVPRALQLHAVADTVHDVASLHDIDTVWVEDTLVGNNIGYSIALAECKGAVMAGLAMHRDVRLVNVSSWKKAVVGRGNATKDQVKDYIGVSHGPYAPLCGDDQDLYDAACIALYGRQVVERVQQLVEPGRLADPDEPGRS
jgi:Holliday junction resolvasome RuvABC endonuclease subunit